MNILKSVQFNKVDDSEYPFNLPLLQNGLRLDFVNPVTIVVGENGAGKSTIIEAIAAGAKLPAIGGADSEQDETLISARKLADAAQFTWLVNKHRGFFLRAEDFFNFTKKIRELHQQLSGQIQEYDELGFTGYGKQLAVGSATSQIKAMERKYGIDLDHMSHGESFLKLLQSRLVPEGLFILDEPEAPFSPKRQLALLALIDKYVKQGAQFIIVTHSPILMAFPNAQILSVEATGVSEIAYSDIEHVSLMHDFMQNPERYLQYLFENTQN